MSQRASRFRAGRVSALVLAAGLALATVTVAAPAAGAPSADPSRTAVAVSVLDVNPTSPGYTTDRQPLILKVALTNTGAQPLQQLSVTVARDVPITDVNALEQLMASPKTVDPSSTVQMQRIPLSAPLAPKASAIVTVNSSTSGLDDGTSQLCLCYDGVYPIDITVLGAVDDQHYPTEVGFGQTYLPSFQDKPTPARVSWVWPLIDRPHRLTSDTTFTDDVLATSVASGGRLYRALDVVAKVTAAHVRMTLLVDPELIDELVVMSHGYRVGTEPVAGSGGSVADAWLTTLRGLLNQQDVVLTPWADPDVDTLAQSGTPWLTGSFTAAAQERVASVLGGAASDLAWPPTTAVSRRGVSALLATGTSTIMTADSSFAAGPRRNPRPDAITALPDASGGRGARAVVLDTGAQRLTAAVLTRDPSGAGTLPKLVSDLAVRVAQTPSAGRNIALAADRHVDVDSSLAARAITETSSTPWSVPTTVRSAVQATQAADRGDLVDQTIRPQASAGMLDVAARATTFRADFSSALTPTDAQTLLGGVPAAVQRTQSAGWVMDPAAGSRNAGELAALVDHWRRGVSIAQPANGTYTLASSSSPLFVTVVNELSVPVSVRVSLSTANGVIGFHADDIGAQVVQSGQRLPLRVPVHVQRPGRFTLIASLTTPAGTALGQPATLGIRSTALGTIGVIIMVVAGAVLVAALAVRVIRRRRARRREPVAPVPDLPQTARSAADR